MHNELSEMGEKGGMVNERENVYVLRKNAIARASLYLIAKIDADTVATVYLFADK